MSHTTLKNAVHNYLIQHISSYTETTNNWVEIAETTNALNEPLVYFGHPTFGVVEANATHNTFETPLELVEKAHTNATGPSMQRNADSVRISEALEQLYQSVHGSQLEQAIAQITNSNLYKSNKDNFWQGVQFSFRQCKQLDGEQQHFELCSNTKMTDFLLFNPISLIPSDNNTQEFLFSLNNKINIGELATKFRQNNLTWNWKQCAIGLHTSLTDAFQPLASPVSWNSFLTFLNSTQHNCYSVFNVVIQDASWLPVWKTLAEHYFNKVIQNNDIDDDDSTLFLSTYGCNTHFLTQILNQVASGYFDVEEDSDGYINLTALNQSSAEDEFYDFIQNTYPNLIQNTQQQQPVAVVNNTPNVIAQTPNGHTPYSSVNVPSSDHKDLLDAISQNKYGKIITLIQSKDADIVNGLKTGVFINHALTVQNPDAFTELLKATPQLHNSTVTMLRHSVSRFEAYAKPAYEQTKDDRLLIALLEWQMGVSPNMVNKTQQQWIFDQWQQHPNKNTILVTAAALSSTAWLVKPWKMELTQIAQTQPELLLEKIPQAMIAQRYAFVRETVRFLKIPPSAVDCGGISLLTKAQMLADNRQKDKQQSQSGLNHEFDLNSFFAHFSHSQKINNIEPTTSFLQAVKLMETQFKIAAKKPSM